MYPVLRLFSTLIRSRSADKIAIDQGSETSFICRPWDIDMFMEMNNGRILTLYDLGRFNLGMRIGLNQILRNNRWGLVVAGSTVRYRKRIRAFDKVTMHSQIVAVDKRWVYIMQSMWVKDQPASSILLRTGVTSKGKTLPVADVLTEFNRSDWQPEPDGWVKEWIASEAEREWPPQRLQK